MSNGKRDNRIGNAPDTVQLTKKFGINHLTISATTPTNLAQLGAGNVITWFDSSIATSGIAAPSGFKNSDVTGANSNTRHGKTVEDW